MSRRSRDRASGAGVWRGAMGVVSGWLVVAALCGCGGGGDEGAGQGVVGDGGAVGDAVGGGIDVAAWTGEIDLTVAAAAAADAAEEAGVFSVPGAVSPWRFPLAELRHLAEGAYWEGWGEAGSVPAGGDVPSVIAAYGEELAGLGVRLLVVPVPAKASLYPEKLTGNEGTEVPGREGLIAALRGAGLEVVDVWEVLGGLEGARACATDSHWSPEAGRLVAGAIAAKYREEDWAVQAAAEAGAAGFVAEVGEEVSLRFVGDLVPGDEREGAAGEELPMVPVGGADGGVLAFDGASPVLVLGDSHTMVFRDGGDMLATGAGLVDHLAAGLGFPIDREASKASGGDGARRGLARRAASQAGYWEGKELVVWVFSEREFTQGKWERIPAQP